MKSQIAFFSFFLLFLMPILASADYNIYNQYGDDNGHGQYIRTSNAQTNFSQISIANANNGSMTQPILDDINGDGVSDLFMGNGNSVYVLNGEDASSIQATLPIGALNINPVICDINNDGTLDYVAIADNGTPSFDYLWVIDLDSSGSPVIVGTPTLINETNPRGNIACGQFYLKEGDSKNYIMFLDNAKRLYIMRASGSTWVGTNQNLQISIFEPSATTEEANYGIGTGTQALGSHQVAYSNTFDPSGYGSVLFVAGRFAYVYFSDGEIQQQNINISLNASYNPQSFGEVNIYGEIHISPTGSTSAGILYGGSVGNNGWNSLLRVSIIGSHTFGRLLQVDDIIRDLKTSGSSGATFPKYSGLSIVPRTGGNGRDYLYILTNQEAAASINNAPWLRVLYAENFSTAFQQNYNYPTFYNSLDGFGAPAALTGMMSLTTADFNKDGQTDIMFTSGGSEELCIGYPPFTLVATPTFSCIANITSSGATYTSPTLYNSQNSLHLAYTTGSTSAWFTGVSIAGAGGILFNISQAGVTSNTSLDVIRVNDPSQLFTYNYAVACDIGDLTLYNELFTFGYNFTTRNVSTPVAIPESYLTSNGVRFTYTNATPAFYLAKNGNQGYRTTLTTRIPYSYTTTGNSVVDVFWLASDNTVTYVLEINKTGTSYTFSRSDIGGILTNLSTQTITTGFVDLHLVFTPLVNPMTAQAYFEITLELGNTSIATDTSQSYLGTDIKSIEWYTDNTVSENQTITIHSLGLFSQNNIFPELLQFTNPTQLEPGQPSQEVIQGDGFSVLTVSNNTFGSYCVYQAPGTYLQRHYMGELNNASDYSNYRDFSVTVVGQGATPSINDTNPTAGDGSNDLVTGILPRIFFVLGLRSSGSQIFVWLLLSLLVAFIGFIRHPFAGIIALVIMLIIGFVALILPLWIILILVVICAGIFAVGWRYVLGGS